MWRRTPFTTSMPVPTCPSDDAESHAHSPRRRTGIQAGSSGHPMPVMPRQMFNAFADNTRQSAQSSFNAHTLGNDGPDPFGDANAYFEWLGGTGIGMNDMSRPGGVSNRARTHGKSSTDTSMPDYTPSSSGHPFASLGCRPEEDSFMSFLKVPANTPTTGGQGAYKSDGACCFLVSSLANGSRHSLPSGATEFLDPSRSCLFLDQLPPQSADAGPDSRNCPSS